MRMPRAVQVVCRKGPSLMLQVALRFGQYQLPTCLDWWEGPHGTGMDAGPQGMNGERRHFLNNALFIPCWTSPMRDADNSRQNSTLTCSTTTTVQSDCD